jgi:hypothetical protein
MLSSSDSSVTGLNAGRCCSFAAEMDRSNRVGFVRTIKLLLYGVLMFHGTRLGDPSGAAVNAGKIPKNVTIPSNSGDEVPSLALSLDRRLLSLALPLLILVPLQDLPSPFQYDNRLNANIYLAIAASLVENLDAVASMGN